MGIPDRKTRGGGGGDTGDAVKLRDGWADMEVVARTTEKFNKKSEKQELKVILKILKDLKKIQKTSIINIDIKYPRNKTDNLNSKVTAYSTLLGTQTMEPEDALDIVDIISDISEVVARGEEYWKKKREEQQAELAKQQGQSVVTQEGGNSNDSSGTNGSGTAKSNSTTKSTNDTK